ncbi:MAG: pyruvate dehydrogenase (acetyl-transferring), homodimeric type [Legionellaceae bacterium]|nr:pyruvate dehydrogenase (acetyl-transferring), homodimeric type [Legionellaceae bacterium]
MTNDANPAETQEWLEAFADVLENEGPERARFLVSQVANAAFQEGLDILGIANSPHRNTIPVEAQPEYPGDIELESRIDDINRYNAMTMVVRANKYAVGVGGHISTPFSIARLYEVGLHHHFHAPSHDQEGDLVFFQGHATPINYARSFLEGVLNEEQLKNFRQEIERDGLSSYPHPWLMPDYWQFPTVSMGLSAIQAVYQAHFLKYLHLRGISNTENRHVWVFCGDGEMDEPESRGALHLAARRKLDNLILVINCNLQRLDGPVFGNGSIIREFERIFRGMNWRVIKVLWGSQWDPIFAKDKDGLIEKRMTGMVDGEFQNYGAKDGAFIRENFFNSDALKALVSDLSDDDLFNLFRSGLGGHDFVKIHAAYQQAEQTKGRPTVILVHTVKGFGLGQAGEGQNIAHNVKKMSDEERRYVRDRFNIPLKDKEVDEFKFYHPGKSSAEVKYLAERRKKLGGHIPSRVAKSSKMKIPALDIFAPVLKNSGDREVSNTMSFVRCLTALLKDKNIGKHIVPIVPDECRTFGMEGMFRQFGIYTIHGQQYTPVDREQLMYYRQATDGQVMEEGISEGGAMSLWMAAATSYSTNHMPMIPFYVYYSMFGHQRVGDYVWAAGDMRARGFLIGATAGRTSLPGEGLQHTDGHSHVFASVVPNSVAYDTTYGYELAVVIQDGLRRMYQENEDVHYYLTVTTESYSHPDMPKGVEEGIVKGMYLLKASQSKHKHHVQLLGSGTILREVEAAAELLEKDHNVSADVWSATSFNELRRDGLSTRRWNHMHPDKKPKPSYVETCLKDSKGPVIAASDYIRAYADQIREWVPGHYVTLGTDGFGRSDTRDQLRYFHENNRYFIVINALKALADEGKVAASVVKAAMKQYKIDSEKPDPITV